MANIARVYKDNGMMPEWEDRQFDRKRKLAELLQQQSLQSPEGQMVSGHYVAPSITQYMAQALKGWQAGNQLDSIDNEQKDYAEALRQNQTDAITELQNGMGDNSVQNRSAILSYLLKTNPEKAAGVVSQWGNEKPHQVDPYFSPAYDATRGAGTFNHRTGTYDWPTLEQPIVKPSDSPELQGKIAGAKAEATANWNPNTDVDGVVSTDANVARGVNAPVGQFSGNPQQIANDIWQSNAPQEEKMAALQALNAQLQGGALPGIRVPTKAQQKQTEADITADKELKVAAQKPLVEAEASSKVGLPDYIAQAQNSASLVDDLINHPGLPAATGLQGSIDPRNYIAGTDATNFKIRLDQLKGQQFMQAYQNLKGGGQITEVEGKKATDAISRMNTASSSEEFIRAAKEFQSVVKAGVERAKKKAGVQLVPKGEPMAAPQRKTVKFGDL